MELFAAIRRDHRVEELSIRALAGRHRVHRRTVLQALESAAPPPRKRPLRIAPRLQPYKSAINAMLRSDPDAPKKQRHTARRVWRGHQLGDKHRFGARPGDQPGQPAAGEPGRGQTLRQPGMLAHVGVQCFVVDLRRLGRRPQRPGAHRRRTRSMVRRCNRTPNRSATCSAMWAPDPMSARINSTISGRSFTGPRRPRRSSSSPAIPA